MEFFMCVKNVNLRKHLIFTRYINLLFDCEQRSNRVLKNCYAVVGFGIMLKLFCAVTYLHKYMLFYTSSGFFLSHGT